MNTTSSRLAEHLYPNTPAHPQLVFRICRQGTIEADGSLRPPGAGDPSARKFRWSEQEVVRHIKGGSYERSRHFISCTFSLPVALYYWAQQIRSTPKKDPWQQDRVIPDELFMLCIIDVQGLRSNSSQILFPTLKPSPKMLEAFGKEPKSTWNYANASCEAVIWGKVEGRRVKECIAMPSLWTVFPDDLVSLLEQVNEREEEMKLPEFLKSFEKIVRDQMDSRRTKASVLDGWIDWFPTLGRRAKSGTLLDGLGMNNFTLESYPMDVQIASSLRTKILFFYGVFYEHVPRTAHVFEGLLVIINLSNTYADVAKRTKRSVFEKPSNVAGLEWILRMIYTLLEIKEPARVADESLGQLVSLATEMLVGRDQRTPEQLKDMDIKINLHYFNDSAAQGKKTSGLTSAMKGLAV